MDPRSIESLLGRFSSFDLAPDRTEAILVDSFEKVKEAILLIKDSALLAVDCEGVNLGRHGKLCLVQVATRDQVWLFDVSTLGKTAFASVDSKQHSLKSILQSPTVRKVIYDVRQDSDALYHQYEVAVASTSRVQEYLRYPTPPQGRHRAIAPAF
ncbi:hypothetical protein WJX72_007854 [[Myrmecia] bisecta]|uniref:3'-5' exonuclease domain-containing protein n=1 Tax=[Myrmecia] bisecta TaxID=41462 RepID=A0AAW1PF53_9CHLO